MVFLNPLERHRLGLAPQRRTRVLGKSENPGEVPGPHYLHFMLLDQPIMSVLSDRLKEPESSRAVACDNERLVDEVGHQRRDIRQDDPVPSAYGLGGVQ